MSSAQHKAGLLTNLLEEGEEDGRKEDWRRARGLKRHRYGQSIVHGGPGTD